MSKLWQKTDEPDTDADIFCSFTTGNDYQLDQTYFIKHDIIASKAWAYALCSNGIYAYNEYKTVEASLNSILESYEQGTFNVKPEDEDCHTAIENALIAMTGDLGKKIHTGRSRNDQSLTMIRMFMKDSLWECTGEVSKLIYTINEQFEKYQDDIFIGYSHTQQAMPITIGHYFSAHKESLADDMRHLKMVSDFINQNPLGTGAGFGSPIDINRDVLSNTLNFNKTQNNSLYCQNSRGKFELLFIQSLSQVMLSLQRLATDMIFYTTRELALFKMSDSLSQGSSMMPQKKNPDVFELIRAKSADVMSLEERVKLIIKGLPSGYNRDLQEIKACIVDAYNITKNCTYIMQLAMKHITPDSKAIESKLQSDIVAADYAISKCINNRNLNFRDVYKETMSGEIPLKPIDAVGLRKSKGSPMNI